MIQGIKQSLQTKIQNSLEAIKLKAIIKNNSNNQNNTFTAQTEQQLAIDSLFLISDSFNQMIQFCLNHSQKFQKIEEYRSRLVQNKYKINQLRQKVSIKPLKDFSSHKKQEYIKKSKVQEDKQNSGYLTYYNQRIIQITEVNNKDKAVTIANQWIKMPAQQQEIYKNKKVQKEDLHQRVKQQMQQKYKIAFQGKKKQLSKLLSKKITKKGNQKIASKSPIKEKAEESNSSQMASDILSDSLEYCQPKTSAKSKYLSRSQKNKKKNPQNFIKILHKQKMS